MVGNNSGRNEANGENMKDTKSIPTNDASMMYIGSDMLMLTEYTALPSKKNVTLFGSHFTPYLWNAATLLTIRSAPTSAGLS